LDSIVLCVCVCVCMCVCVAIDSPSDATEVGGLTDDGSDVAHSACGGE